MTTRSLFLVGHDTSLDHPVLPKPSQTNLNSIVIGVSICRTDSPYIHNTNHDPLHSLLPVNSDNNSVWKTPSYPYLLTTDANWASQATKDLVSAHSTGLVIDVQSCLFTSRRMRFSTSACRAYPRNTMIIEGSCVARVAPCARQGRALTDVMYVS